MRTAILVGAGSSNPAGFPSTQDLTNFILSGDGVKKNSDGTYELADSEESMAAVRLVSCAARRLHADAERYFSNGGEVPANYEHLFYLAKQALDEEQGEHDNPAVGSFVAQLKTELTPLIEEASGSGPYLPHGFWSLCHETCGYIADIVWRKLVREPSETKHLEPIVQACQSGRVVGISTLCHDIHLETHLRKRGVALADGFSDPQAGVRYWNTDFSSGKRIPFAKLHGSVDWFIFRPQGSESFFDDKVGITPEGEYPLRFEAKDGKPVSAIDGRPLLLIGDLCY